MKRLVLIACAGLTLLLGGCATTIRSDVTTFQQWPANLTDKSYTFEAAPPPEDTLELQSYQNLVRSELTALGFHEAAPSEKPALHVAMRFMTTDVPVRVVHVYYPPTYGYWGPWGPWPHRYWGGWYPWYDPFWYGPPMAEESVQHRYRREVHISIKQAADNKRLFDVTVHNMSRTMSTPEVMPALVHSAFEGFPGPNGGAREIEVKQEKG